MKNFLKYLLPPLVWVVVIYFLSALPDLHLRFKTPPGTDKIVYAAIYFVLCWLTKRAFCNQDILPILKKSAFMGAFIFSVVYGVLDEYHQKFVPGRSADVYDLLADAGGALLFIAIAWMLQRDHHGGGESAGS